MECYRKYAADCTSYLMFREGWIEMHPRLQFEDITTIWAMTYTNLPVPKYVYYCSSDSLQVYHAKIMVGTTPADLQWPLQVFGVVAARDNIDSMRNMIFNRDRDDCQTLTKEEPYLTLTGPTRAVGLNGLVTIEAELKVKGADKSKDEYFILETSIVACPYATDYRRAWFTGAHGSRLEISIEGLRSCVEATVFLRVIDGTWPAGFRGRFVASIPEVPGEVLLVAFGRAGESIRGDGNMTHLRHVVSVEQSGELIVSAQALDGPTVHRVVDRVQFKAKKAGRSFGSLGVGSCRVGVLVAWSRIRPRCNDGVPAELQQLCHD
ncbi:unnamed protein product [Urochloa decumbens]|uniref:DUF6598 domain-containing protein n=1 Tax=Urochloa decumbens TaxID=240449 RepID=A0ABC8X9N2_9POAL